MSVASKELYLRLSKELATLYVCKQEAYLTTSCEEIMKLHDQDHQSKAVWRAIGDISGKRRSSDNPVIAAEDSAERGRLWQLHFSKLLGAASVDTESIDELPTGVHPAFNHCRFRVDMFDLDELTSAVESMCCGKACGLDNMVTEVLKLTELHPLLLGILNHVWVTKRPPSEWLTSVLVPILKKGSASDCNNYRGIALMSVAAKLYNKILQKRLAIGLDTYLRSSPNGFRSNRSCAQQVFAARRIIEEVQDSSQGKLIGIFIDFSKAFDSVKWTWIRSVLLHYNVPMCIVDAVMSLYTGATTKVKYDDTFTDFIPLSTGVLQGDTLAPYLFVIVLDYVLRTAIHDDSLGFKVANPISRSRGKAKYISELAFADDIFSCLTKISKRRGC